MIRLKSLIIEAKFKLNTNLENKLDSSLPLKKYFKSLFDLLSPNLPKLFFLNLSFKNKGITKEVHRNDIKEWCTSNNITDYILKGRNIIFETSKGIITLKHNMSSMGFNVKLKDRVNKEL